MKRLYSRLVLAAVICLSVLEATSHAQLNAVYFESNVGSLPLQNAIYGFSNDGTGKLTALPGSPYLTGGTGVFDPGGLSNSFDADQQIIVNQAGTLMWAVNGNSNNISVFNINADGSLTPVPGSPFDSAGSDPGSLSLDETSSPMILAVANKASDPNQVDGPPNYTTFFVDATGALTPTGHSVPLAAGSSPSQVILHPVGHLMVTDDFQARTMSTYRYNSTGTMTFLQSVTPQNSGNFLGIAMHPTQPIVYAATPSPTQGKNFMSAYRYQTNTGALTFQSIVKNGGRATCWIAVNAAGTKYYDSETVSNTVSVYDLTNPNKPAFQQQATLPSGGTPLNLAVDPTQKFVYVLQAKGVKESSAGTGVQARLVTLTINSDGTLSALNGPIPITLPTGETPLGLATVLK
ncbi:MAG TPA: beta-propeller fold lactonase family protein [Terriglobales bacterium]|nr:beta-propeller fold lactonase family protein [Terriglobales bacterium]